MNILKKITIFSLLCFLMYGCIKEDRSDCGMLRLRFRYTHNDSGQDLLAARVGDIRVYVFDMTTGLLTHLIDLGSSDIVRGWVDVAIPDGEYTFIAWGGSGDDLMRGGYAVNAQIGRTTLDDFRMMLDYDSAPAGKGGTDAVPHTPDFDHLFYASAENVDVDAKRNQIVDFDFIKNTSTLKVIVNGLEHLTRAVPDLPLDVFCTGRNYLYNSVNGLDNSAPRMLYLPYEGTAEGDSQQVFIKQQRLSIAQSKVDPVMLHIRNVARDNNLLLPLNLVDVIRQNPAYPDQDAIDREDLFVIELSILINLRVTITINGWEIIIVDPDIEW